MCSTGGISASSHTRFRPAPQRSFAALSIRPAFAAACAEHPEATTMISFAMSFFISSICAVSGRIFGLLHPTIATAPRITPEVTHSRSGLVVPVYIYLRVGNAVQNFYNSFQRVTNGCFLLHIRDVYQLRFTVLEVLDGSLHDQSLHSLLRSLR